MELHDLQQDIGEWGEATFGTAQNALNLKMRLRQELDELDIALALSDHNKTDGVEEEAADVAILLMGLAHRLGFDLGDVIARKMIVNRARKWPRDRSIPDVVPARIAGSDPT